MIIWELTFVTEYDVNSVSSSLSGPVDASFRALSGRLQFTVRHHKFNKDPLSLSGRGQRRLGQDKEWNWGSVASK